MAYDSEFDEIVRVMDTHSVRFGDDDDVVLEHDNTGGDEHVKVKNQAGTVFAHIAQGLLGFLANVKVFFGARAANHIHMRYVSATDRLEFRDDADTLIFSLGHDDLTAILNASIVSNTVESENPIYRVDQSNYTGAAFHVVQIARGARGGATAAILNNGDKVFEIVAQGYDGADFQELARITMEVGGAPGANDMPGSIRFWTTPDGGVTSVVRLTIGADGSFTYAGNQNITGTVTASGNISSTAGSVTAFTSLNGATLAVSTTALITGLLTLTAGITGMFITTGGRRKKTTAVAFADSPYTVLATDHVLLINTTGGAVELLLEAAPGAGRELVIKDANGTADTNAITVTANGAQTIDGVNPSISINWEYGGVGLIWNGADWKRSILPNSNYTFADGDYGDITISGAGTVFTIDNDAVTYGKMQNISATDMLLGRSTAGAGNTEEIPCTAAGRALLDDASASAQRTTLGLGALALQGDGDKGDVTVSGSGSVFTVDNDAITYAKMQNVSATDMLLGRSTAGAGNVEEIPCTAAGRALLDDASASAQRTTLGLASGNSNATTVTGTANVASLGLNVWRWGRIGDEVFFSGSVDVTPTAGTTTTTFRVDLPIASNFSAAAECAGGGAAEQAGAINPVIVYADTSPDGIVCEFVSINTSAHIVHFSGGYTVY